MGPHRTAASLILLCLSGGPCLAQAAPSAPATRQPRPAAAPDPTAPVDLEATRKRFDANAAKTALSDRKRDLKLKQSMGSICAGCEPASPGKRTRVSRPSRRDAVDEADPAD
jgi:hypothetical protein